MFKPVSIFIGLRYTRTRKRSVIISFVSIISMLGIALGVLAMIVVLSVINGSTAVMRAETLKSIPHATVTEQWGNQGWQALADQAMLHPDVLAAAPYIEGEAWVRYQGTNHFIRIRGVDPTLEALIVENPGTQFRDLLTALGESDNGMIMGARLAGNLAIYSNQSVGLTPLRSLLRRSLSDSRSFTVLGTADFGFYGNDSIALISLYKAQELFGGESSQPIHLRLKVADVFAAREIAHAAFNDQASDALEIVPWNESQRTLFDALRMEKILTGFMLLMIVIIGAVNIISTLVMVVADKGADIAILRTMGAGRGTIMGIFIVQGTLAGLLGTLVGSVMGVAVAFNLTAISRGFENLLNTLLAPNNVYMISYLQSDVLWSDVVIIALCAMLVSFLATLYPAYRASRVQPAEVLRYE